MGTLSSVFSSGHSWGISPSIGRILEGKCRFIATVSYTLLEIDSCSSSVGPSDATEVTGCCG